MQHMLKLSQISVCFVASWIWSHEEIEILPGWVSASTVFSEHRMFVSGSLG